MKCFVHRETDAVAVCKSCGKGVCPACAASATGGVVCGERCGAELTRLNAFV